MGLAVSALSMSFWREERLTILATPKKNDLLRAAVKPSLKYAE